MSADWTYPWLIFFVLCGVFNSGPFWSGPALNPDSVSQQKHNA